MLLKTISRHLGRFYSTKAAVRYGFGHSNWTYLADAKESFKNGLLEAQCFHPLEKNIPKSLTSSSALTSSDCPDSKANFFVEALDRTVAMRVYSSFRALFERDMFRNLSLGTSLARFKLEVEENMDTLSEVRNEAGVRFIYGNPLLKLITTNTFQVCTTKHSYLPWHFP